MANWVFEGSEVMKTGRVASRVLSRGQMDKLVEITPVDAMTGCWKKWVSESNLYKIEPEEEKE